MTAMMTFQPLEDRARHVLDRIGVTITADGPIVTHQEAANGYIHHSSEPVACVAYRWYPMLSPRFRKLKLTDLVAKRPSMDGAEAQALAWVCGATEPLYFRPKEFAIQLRHVIAEDHLSELFPDSDPNEDHYAIRPLGYRRDGIDKAGIRAWRQAYNAMTEPRRIMAATILCLYRGRVDTTWLGRAAPAAWYATDAVNRMDQADMLSDWGRLVALYPGW